MQKRFQYSLIILGLILIAGTAFFVADGASFQGLISRFSKWQKLPQKTVTCTDSDGGLEYKTKGSTYGSDEVTKTVGTYKDSCGNEVGEESLQNGVWVAEKHCSSLGNYVHTQWYKCASGCTDGKCNLLKSEFLKNNETAQNILNGEEYNMEELGLEVGYSDGDKNTFAYRIVSALQMIGYNTDIGMETSRNKPQILLLNQFQRNHSLPETNFLTKDTLIAIDSELFEREALDSYWEELAILSPFQERHENEYPKAHSAMIFTLAYSVLPEYLQSDADELTACVQCVPDYEPTSNTIIDPYVNNENSVWGLPFPGFSIIRITLHEYAHQLDGVMKRPNPTFPHRGMIDTRTFYDISYVGVSEVENWPFEYDDNCFARRTEDVYEFISTYAENSHGVNHPEDCPEDYYTVAEDFAESFSAYVASGQDFRAAAVQHPIIRQKYNWLKDNVFEGIEYNTNFAWGNASGCTDIYADDPERLEITYPGYLKCDPSYVWDGEINILE